MVEKEFLNTKEAAAFLGLKISYLYKLIERNKIPYYRPFGRICYFDKNELKDFVRNRK